MKKLFNKIEKENDGILDILANCAYSGIPVKFYEPSECNMENMEVGEVWKTGRLFALGGLRISGIGIL